MATIQENKAYIEDSSRFPKLQSVELVQPRYQFTNEEYNRIVEYLGQLLALSQSAIRDVDLTLNTGSGNPIANSAVATAISNAEKRTSTIKVAFFGSKVTNGQDKQTPSTLESTGEEVFWFANTGTFGFVPNGAIVSDGITQYFSEWKNREEYTDAQHTALTDKLYYCIGENRLYTYENNTLTALVGDTGNSAYQDAVLRGYTGTLDQWLASLKGPKGDDGDDGQPGATGATGAKGNKGDTGSAGRDAYNPFKGWYSSSSDLSTAVSSPVVGDFAFVKGATAADPVAVYECATAGTWSDSGLTFNPNYVQQFADGEDLQNVHIVNNDTTGGASNVFSAERGKILREDLTSLERRFDKATSLFCSDNLESGDAAMAESANDCIKALHFTQKPATGHRYVLTYLYHWGDGADFQISVADLNESAGTSTTLLNQYQFTGNGIAEIKDGNNNVIGSIYADTTQYSGIIAIADKAITRMPYCGDKCFDGNQDILVSARLASAESNAAAAVTKAEEVGEILNPKLLDTAGIEPSDVTKCDAANGEVKALYLAQAPADGHRYVLNYLYLQVADSYWFFSITDLNVSAGTSSAIVTNYRAKDGEVTPIEVGGTEIGQVLFDKTNYALIADQGEGLARLPFLKPTCFDKMAQMALKDAELVTATTTAKNAASRVGVVEGELFPTLLGTAGAEPSDIVKCAAANKELRSLYLSVKPATGHRFVVTQIYLQTSDYSWYYTIQDYNVSAGTATILVNALYAADKTMSIVRDTSGNDIGYIYLDSDEYTLIADQGEGVARLPYLLDACFDLTSQINLFKSAVSEQLASIERRLAKKTISVWGDSITWGSASTANALCYCARLQTMITQAGHLHKVINCGVGGDNMPTILGRMGATMLYLDKDITIPASASSYAVVDEVSNYQQVGRHLKASCKPTEQIQLMMQGDLGRSHIDDEERDGLHTTNPMRINGVDCVWSWNPTAEGRVDEGEYRVAVASTQSANLVVKKGTPLYTHGAKLIGDIAVFAMGTNGGFSTAADYVAMVEKAVDALGTGKYIVCSPYGGTALAQQGVEGLQTLEAALAERFGARFFNWRKYLSEEGLDVEGLVPTSADNTAMEDGKCPPSLLADEVHPNDYGHDAIARRLFAMMDALGYLE